MESITKTSCGILRKEMNEALAKVAEKHGLVIDIGNIRFDSDSLRTTINARLDCAETKFQKDYRMYAPMENLPELNSDITVKGDLMKIVGWNTKAKKYPILVKGRKYQYKMSVEMVKSYLFQIT